MRAAALLLCVLACLQGGEAFAWHGYRQRHHGFRYLTVRAAPIVLPGYHCPLGQWWRPSLRVCQGTPVSVPVAVPVVAAPLPPVPVALSSRATLPPVTGAVGARTVSTDTRVVGRRRWRTKDGATTTYTVVTRVVERTPRAP